MPPKIKNSTFSKTIRHQNHTIITTLKHTALMLFSALMASNIIFYTIRPNIVVPQPDEAHVIRYMESKFQGENIYKKEWFRQMKSCSEMEQLELEKEGNV